MASSRLEKVGTIYSRLKGLLKSGALKEDDLPIWYDIYKAFPPKYEPRYDRPAPDISIRNIFYPEDTTRSKFHKGHKSLPAVNLSDQQSQTQTQKFIFTYNKLREEGKVPEENVYAAAIDVINVEKHIATEKQNERRAGMAEESSLASSFQEAQREKKLEKSVNIADIFKD